MTEGGRLGKYEIRRTLGRGAAGVVQEGWDPVLQRRVAIKTVRLDDATDPDAVEQIDRFRREARAAGQLVHPNIVTVHDYGEADGVAYIVMEYIEGPSLKTVVESGLALARGDIVRIMEDVLAGLSFSHQHGVIHRDIKPGNVMLTSRDLSNARAKIADFGIARIESSTLTQAGTLMGTPAYMAPEQFLGEPIDARSDIYAAGVLLYQLLTGQRPFEGSISSIMHQALTITARPPSMLVMTVDPVFDQVVMRAIAKRPAQRFQYAAAFAEALREAAQSEQADAPVGDPTIREPIRAPLALTVPPMPIAPGRANGAGNRLSLVVAAIGLVAALGVGGWLYMANLRPPRDPQPVAGLTVTPPAPQAAPQPTTQPSGGAIVEPSRTPQPVETVTQAPPPVLAPAPNPSEPSRGFTTDQRAELARLVAGLDCALIDGAVRPDGATLRGVAAPGAESLLRRSLADRQMAGRLEWLVSDTNPVFCPTLEILRTIGPSFDDDGPRVRLTLADDRTVLREGDAIRPRVVMPAFSAYLTVDYVTQDGTVQHLYPQVADQRQGIKADAVRRFAPSEWVNLGDPGPGQRGWEASEPFGRDLLIAIASSRPLFATPRPSNAEAADAYLRALNQVVREMRRNGELSTTAAIGILIVKK